VEGFLAWLDEDGPEPTELFKVAPDRVDGVRVPATGASFLVVKGARVAASPRRPQPPVLTRVVKSDPERRFTLCLGYGVGLPDQTVAQDGYRDVAGADAVEQAAWHFLTKGRKVGLDHTDGTEGAGEVVESYIWRGDPKVFKNADGVQTRVVPGDWVIGIRWSPDAWQAIKAGRVKGVSMQGYAERRRLTAATAQTIRERRAA
jgi:hypothetical protein